MNRLISDRRAGLDVRVELAKPTVYGSFSNRAINYKHSLLSKVFFDFIFFPTAKRRQIAAVYDRNFRRPDPKFQFIRESFDVYLEVHFEFGRNWPRRFG